MNKNEFLKDYAPYKAAKRAECLKGFTETLLQGVEVIDLSGIPKEQIPLSGAISGMEMLICDCLDKGLAIMAPSGYVWGWNGQWFKMDPEEGHSFLGEYLKQSGVPMVNRSLVNQAANYLMQISKGMDISLESFRSKVAPIAKRNQI